LNAEFAGLVVVLELAAQVRDAAVLDVKTSGEVSTVSIIFLTGPLSLGGRTFALPRESFAASVNGR